MERELHRLLIERELRDDLAVLEADRQDDRETEAQAALRWALQAELETVGGDPWA